MSGVLLRFYELTALGTRRSSLTASEPQTPAVLTIRSSSRVALEDCKDLRRGIANDRDGCESLPDE